MNALNRSPPEAVRTRLKHWPVGRLVIQAARKTKIWRLGCSFQHQPAPAWIRKV